MSINDWCNQLKIKRSTFRRAIKLLIALGFVDVKRTSKKFPAWYKINEFAVASYLTKRGYKLSTPTINNIFTALSADKNNLLLTAENLNITNDGLASLYYSSLELIAKKLLSDNPSVIPHMFTQSAKKIKALTGLTANQQFRYREKSASLLQIKTTRYDGDKNLYYQVISCTSSIAQLEHMTESSAVENSHESAPLESKNSHESAPLESKNSHESAPLESKNSHESAPLTYKEKRTYKHINKLKIFKKGGFPNNPSHMIGSDQGSDTGSLTEQSATATIEQSQPPATATPCINQSVSDRHVEQENNFTESDYLTGRPSPEFDFELDYTGSKRITERPTPPPFDDQLVDFDITGKIIHPTVEQPVVIGSVSPPAQEQPVVIGSGSGSPTDSPSEQFDPMLDSPMFPFFWLKFAAPLISPLFSLLAHGSGSNDQTNNSGSPP